MWSWELGVGIFLGGKPHFVAQNEVCFALYFRNCSHVANGNDYAARWIGPPRPPFPEKANYTTLFIGRGINWRDKKFIVLFF